MVGYETTDAGVIKHLLVIYDEWKRQKMKEKNMAPGNSIIEIETAAGTVKGILRSVEKNKRLALLCRGLTGDLNRRLSVDDLADALAEKGWSSIRFDYRGRGNSYKAPNLPTVSSMMEDVTCVLSHIKQTFCKEPDAVIAIAIGCRLALECLKEYPTIPLIMWAPIIWFQTSAEIRYRMHEYRRTGVMEFDRTRIGDVFLESARDPTYDEVSSWVFKERHHFIAHGIEDEVVPMRLLTEGRDLIQQAGGDVKLFVVSGEHPHPKANVQTQIQKVVEVVGTLP